MMTMIVMMMMTMMMMIVMMMMTVMMMIVPLALGPPDADRCNRCKTPLQHVLKVNT